MFLVAFTGILLIDLLYEFLYRCYLIDLLCDVVFLCILLVGLVLFGERAVVLVYDVWRALLFLWGLCF